MGFSSFASLGLLFILRIIFIMPTVAASRPRKRKSSEPCSLAVFLGSGGHTSEALALVSAVNFSRFTPRTYVISQGDDLSMQKVTALELSTAAEGAPQNNGSNPEYTILTIPRARRVHQSLLSALPNATLSLLACIYHVVVAPFLFLNGRQAVFADVLLLNGPGTCFILCIAVYVNKFLGLRAPRIIYVESFARVRSLSLSGRLIRPFVDRFVTQWPQSLKDGGRGECHGWLV